MSIKNKLEDAMDQRFLIHQKIGQGSFGAVYSGYDTLKKQLVAIKVEYKDNSQSLLQETYILNLLKGIKGVPKFITCGQIEGWSLVVLSLCGPNLQSQLKYLGGKFSIPTVLMIGDQMLTRLEHIHSRGIIHRDIKPDNIVIGPISKVDELYLIDLGLAQQYIKKGQHVPPRQKKLISGTLRFCSKTMHYAMQQSRRDDIESLGYTLVYLAKGQLPWQNVARKNSMLEKIKAIGKMKRNISVQQLCKGLPKCFRTYFNYVKKMGFTTRPNYKMLRRLFRTTLMKTCKAQFQFDWYKGLRQKSKQQLTPKKSVNVKKQKQKKSELFLTPSQQDEQEKVVKKVSQYKLLKDLSQNNSKASDDRLSPEQPTNQGFGIRASRSQLNTKKKVKSYIKKLKCRKTKSQKNFKLNSQKEKNYKARIWQRLFKRLSNVRKLLDVRNSQLSNKISKSCAQQKITPQIGNFLLSVPCQQQCDSRGSCVSLKVSFNGGTSQSKFRSDVSIQTMNSDFRQGLKEKLQKAVLNIMKFNQKEKQREVILANDPETQIVSINSVLQCTLQDLSQIDQNEENLYNEEKEEVQKSHVWKKLVAKIKKKQKRLKKVVFKIKSYRDSLKRKSKQLKLSLQMDQQESFQLQTQESNNFDFDIINEEKSPFELMQAMKSKYSSQKYSAFKIFGKCKEAKTW